MKKEILMLFVGLTAMYSCNTSSTNSTVAINNNIDSVSYAIGSGFGSNVIRQIKNAGDTTLNIDALIGGFSQGIKEGELLIDETTGTAVVNEYMRAKEEERKIAEREAFSKNILLGEEFHAANGQREGVTTTESGLQYEVVTLGTGELPIDGDRVKVNYEGTLLDGQVFDSNYDRGVPVEFGINQVIAGWTEGLKLMPAGSTYKFYIPHTLAYGENPPPGSNIEPFSSLIFTVEFIELVK